MKVAVISASAEETIALGQRVAQQLPEGAVVCLLGDLGGGKTTFAKGLVCGATGTPIEEVLSPTFVYLHLYEGERTAVHFDLYRLSDPDEFLAAGFEELLYGNGICCIEWAERITDLLPERRLELHFAHSSEHQREITIRHLGDWDEEVSF